MKKLVVISLLMGLVASVHAQRIIQVQSRKESLQLLYELPLTQPGNNYATIVTPFLCGVSDTLALEPVYVRGALNARKLHREYVLKHKGEEPSYIKAEGMPATFAQASEISVANHPWVKNSPLRLLYMTDKEGCCSVEVVGLGYSDPFAYDYRAPLKPVFSFVPDFTGVAGRLEHDNPLLEHVSSYRPYDNTRILRKEGRLIYVNFPVGKSELKYDFEDNANRLDRIVSITRQIMNDTTSSVKRIQIIGLASVEGNDAANSRLAGERAEALKRYVQNEIDIPDSLFELANGGAAWTEFRDQVNDADFAGKEQVLKLIDETKDPNRRERLIRSNKAYNYIRENLLADQRNAGYVRIYWDYVPDDNAKVINQAAELLKQEQWQQALDLLQTVKTDERAQNALAVAYYMTGNEDAAVYIWRRSAALGDNDARRNLEQLELE